MNRLGSGRIIIGALLTLAVGLTITGCRGSSADESISTNINSKLASDSILRDADLTVETEDGVVTLSGTLKSEVDRTRAVEIARETDGVVRVIDKIDVDGDSTQGTNDNAAPQTDKDKGVAVVHGTKDLALEQELKTKFAASEDVSASDLDVDVKDGVVTLSAEEGKHPNLQRAAEIARTTGGVKSVIIQ